MRNKLQYRKQQSKLRKLKTEMLVGSIHPPFLGDHNAAEFNSRRAMMTTQNRQVFYANYPDESTWNRSRVLIKTTKKKKKRRRRRKNLVWINWAKLRKNLCYNSFEITRAAATSNRIRVPHFDFSNRFHKLFSGKKLITQLNKAESTESLKIIQYKLKR